MFDIIGHRGAGALLPENTMDSFKAAQRLGCSGIELDVHRSADDRLAVIHDSALEKTTNGYGQVRDYRMSELKELDAGGGRTIPALEEIITAFAGSGVFLQVELKGEGTEDLAVSLIKSFGMEKQVRFTSFDHRRIVRVREVLDIHSGILMFARPAHPLKLLEEAGAHALHLSRRHIDHSIVEEIHEAGKRIVAWDEIVSDEVFRCLLETGVDGATSDRPDLFINFLEKWNSPTWRDTG